MQRTSTIVHMGLALTGIAITTWVMVRLIPVNASTTGFVYLILVLAVATLSNLKIAAITSVAAMLSYNFFFLPPVGRFTIADPQNWVALLTFLITALVASHLSDRVREQALDASRRQREMEQLYSLSRSILLTDSARPVGFQAVRHIAEIFESPSVVLYDSQTGSTYAGGASDLDGIEPRLKSVVLQGIPFRLDDRGVDIWPISLGGKSVGALAVRDIHISDGAMQALLNLVAIALERVRTVEAANRAEAARQSEEFKSTLLDAIAHEFKTPLTSIKAASTSLLAAESVQLRPEQQELASVIDEEADRLTLLVSEAVRLSEIEAGKMRLQRSRVSLPALIEAAISSFGARADGRVRKEGPCSGPPHVLADPELITLALRQLIDNGLKYSPASSPIGVRVEAGGDRVVVRVSDQGQGIPEQDRERIFEKFYRRDSSNRVPGTGLGLHIAREIARSHGGDLWVETGATGGANFCLALPATPEAGP